jgi:flagellar basal body-associated protein FliL
MILITPAFFLQKKNNKKQNKKQRENHIRSGYENCPEFVVDLQRSV